MLLLERRFLLNVNGAPVDLDARQADVVITVPPSAAETVIVVRAMRPRHRGRAVLGFQAAPEVAFLRAELVGKTEENP